MSDDPLAEFTNDKGDFDTKRASELVHARYLGDTEIVVPDLGTRDRCCSSENKRIKESKDYEAAKAEEPEASHGPHPHVTLRKNDVVLLDRYSAVGREDFEIVEDKKPPKAAASASPTA